MYMCKAYCYCGYCGLLLCAGSLASIDWPWEGLLLCSELKTIRRCLKMVVKHLMAASYPLLCTLSLVHDMGQHTRPYSEDVHSVPALSVCVLLTSDVPQDYCAHEHLLVRL